MRTIVCPTDFSSNASNAVSYSAALAEQSHSKIILVHAFDDIIVYSEQPFASVQLEDKQIRLSAQKKLDTLKTKLEKAHPGLKVETQLIQGVSADELVSFAKQQNAEVIIMGTTGTTKLERLLMGSTTSRVIRKASCPVICVPKDARFRGINKIIFSTDLQEDNIGSAKALMSFAKKFDAEIVFLYVDDKHLIHSDEEITRMTTRIRGRIKYPKISGYISKDPHITKGIASFLKKHPADLLVMFTHKKHFPESLFHQSITRMMSLQTKIPLLSFKLDDEPLLNESL